MAAINGTELTLYIPSVKVGGTTPTWIAIGLSKSASISLAAEMGDVSTKDSSGWSESLSLMKSWTVDFEALVDLDVTSADPNTAINILPLWDYFKNGDKLKIAWGKGGSYWYGDAFITSLEESAEAEQPVSFSGSLQGTSVLALGSTTPPTYPT
jgi:predicted secreted protein|tara:strand:+ start:7 stop:468 length:462 start_codon:yes stop_codon:yes gene_type:complete